MPQTVDLGELQLLGQTKAAGIAISTKSSLVYFFSNLFDIHKRDA